MVIGCLRETDDSIILCVAEPHQTSQKVWGGFLYGLRSVQAREMTLN